MQEIVLQNHACYVNLSDVVRRIENLKSLSAWKTNVSETNIILNKFSTEYNSKIPEFTVAIDDGLGYTTKVYDWYIPEDHSIYSIYHRSMKNVTVSNLVHTLVSYFKCPGITYITNDTNIYCHVIPLNSDISEGSSDDEEIKALVPYNRYRFMRNVKCWMLLPVEGECEHCINQQKNNFSQIETKNNRRLLTPAKPNAPLTKTGSRRVIAVLQLECVECKQMKVEVVKMNTHNLEEANRKRKPFLQPYRHSSDTRFDWLENVFLIYFEVSDESVRKREGDFSKSTREKMFISKQTYNGFIISYKSLIGCIKFLLDEGAEYILSERFCQDILEEYFGNQRKLGMKNENPDINQFGYNANTLRIQRNVSCPSGNTRARYNSKHSWEEISDNIVPKGKR